ncbi:hypothetical protein PI95_034655 [Hassallia byssoidea VB512170]|uniref:Uncharacterized protein n=1 Tax=Hassallia byssoidea VB512170 TaxID=1304833 RepID=A0A846HJD4_9CYAN|nr:hypothetical protein [Hassalia byssoidea]NEU77462.1 hypothetical protein [Hassalia byssoidea VB512170]
MQQKITSFIEARSPPKFLNKICLLILTQVAGYQLQSCHNDEMVHSKAVVELRSTTALLRIKH